MKATNIGKGVIHFKKKQSLKWKEIQEILNYKSAAATGNLTQLTSGSTNLVDKLAHAFGVTPSEFVEQCTVEAES